MAVGRAELIMQEWKEFIAAACKKDTGEIVDAQEVIKSAEAKIASFNDHCKGIAAVAGDLLLILDLWTLRNVPKSCWSSDRLLEKQHQYLSILMIGCRKPSMSKPVKQSAGVTLKSLSPNSLILGGGGC